MNYSFKAIRTAQGIEWELIIVNLTEKTLDMQGGLLLIPQAQEYLRGLREQPDFNMETSVNRVSFEMVKRALEAQPN
mgnify:CR=1 FL=1